MKKPRQHLKWLRTALLCSVTFVAITCAVVFLRANAAPEEPPADNTLESMLTEGEGEIKTVTHDDFVTSNMPVVTRSKDTDFVRNAKYSGSYRSELDQWEQMVYDALYQQYVVKKRPATENFTITFNPPYPMEVTYHDATISSGSLNISGIDFTICAGYAAFYFDYPEAFWTRDFTYSYRFPSYSDGDTAANLKQVVMSTFDSYSGAYNDRTKFNNGLNAAVSNITSTRLSSSRYDTVKRIHDYVCENSCYNYDAVQENVDMSVYGHAYTAAPLFTGRNTFVCEGYSKSFKTLCDQFGIPCVLVGGLGGEYPYWGNHMWNYVQMENGAWYCLDSTWDDTLQDGVTRYDYFLVGSFTEVDGETMLQSNHLPRGQILLTNLPYEMVYPPLNHDAYSSSVLPAPVITTGEQHFANGGYAPLTWTPITDATRYLIHIWYYEKDSDGYYTNAVTVCEQYVTEPFFDFYPSDYTRFYIYQITAIDDTTGRQSAPSETKLCEFGIPGSMEIFSDTHEIMYRDTFYLRFSYHSYYATHYRIVFKKNGQTYLDETQEQWLIGVQVIYEYDEEQQANLPKWVEIPFVPAPGDYEITVSVMNLNGGTEIHTSDPYYLSVVEPPVSLSCYSVWFPMYSNKPNPFTTIKCDKPASEVEWYSEDPSIATVSEGKITAVGPGYTKVYCRLRSGGGQSAPCYVSVEDFRIRGESLVIDGTTGSMLAGETDHLVMGNVPSDYVTWKSSAPGVVSVDANGNIVALKKGSASITATYWGYYKDTIKINVVQPTQSLALNTAVANIYAGKTFTFKAIMDKGANEPVFWSVDDPSVASVTSNGVVKGLTQGSTTVRATSLTGKVAAAQVNVITKAIAVEWVTRHPDCAVSRELRYGITPGEALSLTMRITAPENCNDAISWTSSNRNSVVVESISDDGKTVTVRGIKKGVSVVTAKATSGKSVIARVTVVEIPASQITLNKTSADIYVGAAATLTAKMPLPKGNNDVVYWKSSNPSVATVDENGKVTAVEKGSAVITAYSSRNSSVKAECAVTVRTKAQSIQWIEVDTGHVYTTLKRGIPRSSTITLYIDIPSPENCNDTVTWTTSNSKVVAFNAGDPDGRWQMITGMSKGTATITARTGSGKRITAQITVVETPAEQITLNKTSADVFVGATVSLSAKAPLPKGNNDVIYWKSSDPSVATVDINGKVKTLSQGNVIITAYSSQNSSVKAECAITVRTKAKQISWDIYGGAENHNPDVQPYTELVIPDIDVGIDFYLRVRMIDPVDCNDKITWTTSNKSVVRIDSVSEDYQSVFLSYLKPGTATITGKTSSGKKVTAKLTVIGN